MRRAPAPEGVPAGRDLVQGKRLLQERLTLLVEFQQVVLKLPLQFLDHEFDVIDLIGLVEFVEFDRLVYLIDVLDVLGLTRSPAVSLRGVHDHCG